MKAINIPVIIPSYEPDQRLIDLLIKLKKKSIGPVIIVNDGSGHEYDGYFEKAEELIAPLNGIILKHDVNKGKGRALKDAFLFLLNNYPDLIGCVTADSDGQHTPECIEKVRKELIEYPSDLILGVRDFDDPGVPSNSRIGNKLTRKVLKFLCGVKVSDTQTGLRGIPSEFMRELVNTPGERFEFETRMLVDSKDKVRIREVEIETVYDSRENHSTHFNPVKDSIRIYKIFGGIFVKFLLSSLSSCIIDLGLFYFLCKALKSGSTGAIYVMYATVGARVVSATYNYLINYILVFKSKEDHVKSAIKYFALALVQMSLSAGLVTLFAGIFPDVQELFIKIPVDVLLFFCSYYLQHEYVYRNRKAALG